MNNIEQTRIAVDWAKQEKKPLDRPDRPGNWWRLADNEWEFRRIIELNGVLVFYWSEEPIIKGQWLPVTPPPVPVPSEEEDAILQELAAAQAECDSLAHAFTNMHDEVLRVTALLTAAQSEAAALRVSWQNAEDMKIFLSNHVLNEVAIVKKRRSQLMSFLRTNSQYLNDRKPTLDFYDEQIKRLQSYLTNQQQP